jgi:rRNA-processing protein FCF1
MVEKMIKVILDSNFLFVPIQFKTDIFDELEGLLGRFEPIVLSTTVEELEGLLRNRSVKIRRQASLALELAKRCKIIEVEKNLEESCDNVILRIAKEWKCPVATNDGILRRRLREAEVATIFLRQKSLLEIEGYSPH